jgi:glycolate oxidase FAD binding subunit
VTSHRPADERELAAVIAEAAARRTPLAVHGGNTRRGLGRPVQAGADVTTAALSGITLYAPSELILSARAGTPLSEVEEALAAHRQRLAFEPMDHRALYGTAGEPTIGGVVAANVSGPRRVLAGAARDALIGLRAVNGKGEVVRAGGRVMKNVTGYDLVKFLAGSFGTLAVLSEVTFKLAPAPESEVTLLLSGLDPARAVAAMLAALATPFEVSGAAHIPGGGEMAPRTLLRLEGFAAALPDRTERLARLLAPYGPVDRLDAPASQAEWRGIRDAQALAPAADDEVWRLDIRASEAPAAVAKLRATGVERMLLDWGGALLWFATDRIDPGEVRAIAAAAGGHGMLARAARSTPAGAEAMAPLSPALMALSRRAKAVFDPGGILNPGRLYSWM